MRRELHRHPHQNHLNQWERDDTDGFHARKLKLTAESAKSSQRIAKSLKKCARHLCQLGKSIDLRSHFAELCIFFVSFFTVKLTAGSAKIPPKARTAFAKAQ